DEVCKLQNGYKVLEWKLYDSCGAHFLRIQSMQIYMLVEKKYPLTPPILSMMLEKKLQIDYESKMAYQLCKLIIKQLKKIVGIKSLLDAVGITTARVYVNTALMKIMNPQETQQVAARDKKWVPFIEIAFTISKDVLEIFMQQFWYTAKKVQGIDSYEFILANKKCIVNPKVFRTILDICLRVEGANFTDVPDDDTTLAFLIKLGYKAIRILSNVHQIFIKYSTSQILPKKSRGKGSKWKRTVDTLVTYVDVSEVSEPELSRKRTTSKRRVKKKVTISAEDNINTKDPEIALELGKSISLTEAKEEATRKAHVTHARIVTELVLEPTRRKLSEKQEATDIIKALKESRKTSRRQLGIGGSSEGTGSKLGVPDESIVVSATSSEGTGTKPWVPDEEKVISKEKLFLSGEMNKKKDYEELTDAAKADVEKKEEVKDAAKKAELPLTSSSLSVSSAHTNGEEVVVKGVNERSNVVEEVVEVINTAKLIIDVAQVSAASDKDKGKGILIEEPVKSTKKKDQIRLDEETALRLQAEFDEEERLARESAQKEEEANIALIEC
ncbi:hypothetical protein Tco_0070834, partial [Tanacetum coccineum]